MITAWCDGSGTHDAPTGAGVVLVEGGEVIAMAAVPGPIGTNNTAELGALRVALAIVPPDTELEIVSDSEYAIGVVTHPAWVLRANEKLIRALQRQFAQRPAPVMFSHVPGHQGHAQPLNELADWCARLGRWRALPPDARAATPRPRPHAAARPWVADLEASPRKASRQPPPSPSAPGAAAGAGSGAVRGLRARAARAARARTARPPRRSRPPMTTSHTCLGPACPHCGAPQPPPRAGRRRPPTSATRGVVAPPAAAPGAAQDASEALRSLLDAGHRRWRCLPTAQRRRTVAVCCDVAALALLRERLQPAVARQLPPSPTPPEGEDPGSWVVLALRGRGWVASLARAWPHPHTIDLGALKEASERFDVVFLLGEGAPAPAAFRLASSAG